MNFINWTRPRKTILNILFILGILSLFINFIAISSVIVWTYYPQLITKIDKKLPDFYGNNIKALYSRARETAEDIEKFKIYKELYSELEDISTLNKYYIHRQKSAEFLIDYYVENKQLKEAMIIAEKWEKEYPYDFVGKFKYINTLSYIDSDKSLEYFRLLYSRYNDIADVKNRYMDYLLKHKKYNIALSINAKQNRIRQKNINFQLFYADNQTSFSESQSAIFTKNHYKNTGNLYAIEFNKSFKKLSALRFDINKLSNGAIISEINVLVKEKDTQTELKISDINQLKEIKAGKYSIDGGDPFFLFDLPDNLKNYSGQLTIFLSLKIESETLMEKEILHHPEWQLFINSGNGFNEKESTRFILQKDNDMFSSQLSLNYNNTTQVRIDLPSLKTLQFHSIKLTINNYDFYYNKDITLFQSIIKTKSYLKVINSDPFVLFDLKKGIDIRKLKIEIIFNGSKNESI